MDRNTSTGVEKTRFAGAVGFVGEKHLHGRGEDLPVAKKRSVAWETPPRAWRRLVQTTTRDKLDRNTSTGVEKTSNKGAGVINL